MSSCVDVSPIVVSVPKCIKCLVVGETSVTLLAVGLLVVSNANVVVDALVTSLAASPAFHVNVFPFAIVATRTCLKLLNDQRPGSSDISFADEASPHPPVPQVSVPQP